MLREDFESDPANGFEFGTTLEVSAVHNPRAGVGPNAHRRSFHSTHVRTGMNLAIGPQRNPWDQRSYRMKKGPWPHCLVTKPSAHFSSTI